MAKATPKEPEDVEAKYMSLPVERIKQLLDIAITTATHEDEYVKKLKAFVKHTEGATDGQYVAELEDPSNRYMARVVQKLAHFSPFTIKEAKMDDEYHWIVSIKVPDSMEKVEHRYTVNLCHNPEPFFSQLDAIDKEAKQLAENPKLLPEERDADVDDLKKKREYETRKHIEFQSECRAITFDGVVQETKWNDGTIIKFAVPAALINTLIDKTQYLRDRMYVMRLSRKD